MALVHNVKGTNPQRSKTKKTRSMPSIRGQYAESKNKVEIFKVCKARLTVLETIVQRT